MRIATCFLYADVYGKLDDELRQMVRKKFTKLSKDDTPMVRRAAAQSIPILTANLERTHAREFLLPIIKDLLKDANDSVKIHSVTSSIDVAKVADDQLLIRESIIPAFAASC